MSYSEIFLKLTSIALHIKLFLISVSNCTKKGVIVAIDTLYADFNESQREAVRPHDLSGLIDTPPSVDIKHHSKILKDTTQRRRAIEIGNAIIKSAYNSDADKISNLANQLIIQPIFAMEDTIDYTGQFSLKTRIVKFLFPALVAILFFPYISVILLWFKYRNFKKRLATIS